MKATVTIDVDIKYARTALSIAGYDINNKSDEEICEMAIKMNDCYAVKTENINLEKENTNMTDMVELVIKIPEELYNNIQKGCGIYPYRLVYGAIETSIPLPSGHGRIMDVDKVIKKMEEREEQLKDNKSMYETACVETALDMFGEIIIESNNENKEQAEERI